MKLGPSVDRKVVDAATATTIGTVSGWVLDGSSQRVSAVRIAQAHRQQRLVEWADLRFGSDAVMVASGDHVQKVDASGWEAEPLGRMVLTENGDGLGPLRDVEIDPDSGAIIQLETDGGTTTPGDRLLGVGSFAIVVAEPRT